MVDLIRGSLNGELTPYVPRGSNLKEACEDIRVALKNPESIAVRIYGRTIGNGTRETVYIHKPSSPGETYQVNVGSALNIRSIQYLHKIKVLDNGLIAGYAMKSKKRIHVTDIFIDPIVRVDEITISNQVSSKEYKEHKTEESE